MKHSCIVYFFALLISFATVSCRKKRYEVTTEVSSIMATRATFSGFATNLGLKKIESRGFVYSTHSNPTLDDIKVEDGSGKGHMEVTVEGLTPHTTYYVRGFSMLKGGKLFYSDEQSFSTNGDYQEGDIGPAGGLIFYKNPYPVDFDYLEAILPGSPALTWGCSGTEIEEAYYGYLGQGQYATQKIVEECNEPSIAAKYCYELVANGHDDWYLPTHLDLGQLSALCKQKGINTFPAERYWSGTQNGPETAYSFNFADGTYKFTEPKTNLYKVIAIRQF